MLLLCYCQPRRRLHQVHNPNKRELPEEGDPTLDLVISDGSLGKGGLTKIVARLESSMIVLGKAVDEIAGVTHKRFMELDENVHLCFWGSPEHHVGSWTLSRNGHAI